jgi:hypothetical protein
MCILFNYYTSIIVQFPELVKEYFCLWIRGSANKIRSRKGHRGRQTRNTTVCFRAMCYENPGVRRRSRLCRQCLAISFVTLCSQFWSAAKRIHSTAANLFGALSDGPPAPSACEPPSKSECHAQRSRAVSPSPREQGLPANPWLPKLPTSSRSTQTPGLKYLSIFTAPEDWGSPTLTLPTSLRRQSNRLAARLARSDPAEPSRTLRHDGSVEAHPILRCCRLRCGPLKDAWPVILLPGCP